MNERGEAARDQIIIRGRYGTVVFPLRGDRRASFDLPLDLTPAEADRIGRALAAWATPDADSSTSTS